MAESLQTAAAHGFDLTPYIGSSTFYENADISDAATMDRLHSPPKPSPLLVPGWKKYAGANGLFDGAQTTPDTMMDRRSGMSSYASFDSSLPTQVAPATYLPAEPQDPFRAKLYQGILSKKKISESRRINGQSIQNIIPFGSLDGIVDSRQKTTSNDLVANNLLRSAALDTETRNSLNIPTSSSQLPLEHEMFLRSINELAGMHDMSSICRSVFSDEKLQGNNRKRLIHFPNTKKDIDPSIKVPRMWDSYQGLSSTSGSMSSDEKIIMWYNVTVRKVAESYHLKSEDALHQQQRMITQMNETDPIEVNEPSDELREIPEKVKNNNIEEDVQSFEQVDPVVQDDEPLDLSMSAVTESHSSKAASEVDDRSEVYDNPEPFEVDPEALKEPIVDLIDNEVIGYSDDTKVPRSRRECRKGPGIARNLKSAKLWELLLWLLSRPEQYSAVIQWRNKSIGYFKLVSDELLLEIYNDYKDSIPGRVPLKRKILYSSITRALRHYYWNSTLHPTPKRKTYQFGPNATDWQLGVQREHALQSLDYWEKTKHQRKSYSHTLYAEPASPDSSDGESNQSSQKHQVTCPNSSSTSNLSPQTFPVFQNGEKSNGVLYGKALDVALRIEDEISGVRKSSMSFSEVSKLTLPTKIKQEVLISSADQNDNSLKPLDWKPVKELNLKEEEEKEEKNHVPQPDDDDDDEDDTSFLPIDLSVKLNGVETEKLSIRGLTSNGVSRSQPMEG